MRGDAAGVWDGQVRQVGRGGQKTMSTDTSEKGLETLIMRHMTGADGLVFGAEGVLAETPDALAAQKAAGNGWLAGNPKDFDRAYALDVPQLCRFLEGAQPDVFKKLMVSDWSDKADMNRLKFLARLSNEIGKRGVIDVLRKGVEHGALHFDLFYGTPSPGNAKAAALFAKNRFSVTRQLRYSLDEQRRALDLCLFINGLPIATFELKNSLTKQTVEDAVEQYRRDRDPREKLFEFGRCVGISRWTTRRCGCAASYAAKARGFCRSTKAGTMARATHRIRAD